MTLTTIGLGDIYPENLSFLPLTILYVSLGLALTTMSIEAAGNTFRKLHYFGTELKNAKDSVVWFGGKNMTVEEVLQAVGRRYGIPEDEIAGLDFDTLIGGAIIQKEEAKVAEKRDRLSEKKGLRSEKFREQLAEAARPLMVMARQKEEGSLELPKKRYADILDSTSFRSDSLHSFYASNLSLAEAGLTLMQRECVNFPEHDRTLASSVLFCERIDELDSMFREVEDLVPDILPVLREARISEILPIPRLREEPLSLSTATIDSIEAEVQSGAPAKIPSLARMRRRLLSQQSSACLLGSKRTLSQSLGLKVPTENELQNLKLAKSLQRFQATTSSTTEHKPFFLVRISDLRAKEFTVERCKQCLGKG